MPISCHFRDCKALLVTSLTHVSGAIASVLCLQYWLFSQLRDWLSSFLSRVSILMHDIDTANLSVCVSVSFRYRIKPRFHNVIADVIADISVFLCLFMIYRKSEAIFVYLNLIFNRLIYLVYAKSTVELISFEFSDRSVRSLVSAKRSANRWDQTKKKRLTFSWSLVSVQFRTGDSLSERQIQKN